MTPTHFTNGPSSPVAYDGAAVTPNDSTDLALAARALYVGGDGSLSVVTLGGTTLNFVGAKAGTIIPIAAQRVRATGTTATNIVALY